MPGLIEFKFTVESEEPLYIDIYSPYQNGAYLIVDGQVIKNYFSTDDRDNFIKLGKQPVGKEISVIIDMCNQIAASNEAIKNAEIAGFSNEQELLLGEMQVYYENTELVKKKVEALLERKSDFSRLNSSHLKGKVVVSNDNQSLLFTIPYEKGWKIKVDGKNVSARQVLDILMAIELEKGEHTVEMQYIPEWFYLGAVMSGVSIILLLVYYCFSKRKKVASK